MQNRKIQESIIGERVNLRALGGGEVCEFHSITGCN